MDNNNSLKFKVTPNQYKELAETGMLKLDTFIEKGIICFVNCPGNETIEAVCIRSEYTVNIRYTHIYTKLYLTKILSGFINSKVICTCCGSEKVICEAWINPNVLVLDHYSSDSFNFGYCQSCDKYVILTDVEQVKNVIREKFAEYDSASPDKEPLYALVDLTYKGEPINRVKIKYDSDDDRIDNNEYSWQCTGLENMISMADKNDSFIIIAWCHGFYR